MLVSSVCFLFFYKIKKNDGSDHCGTSQEPKKSTDMQYFILKITHLFSPTLLLRELYHRMPLYDKKADLHQLFIILETSLN